MAYKRLVCSGDTANKNGCKERNNMEFLKTPLGEELYKQLKAKVDEHNGNEDNKDNQIKIGNLGSGEYVSKGKHDALQELLNGKETELTTATGLIEELKKATKGDEDLQGKITDYESKLTTLQEELQSTKLKSAVKVALLSAKAVDVDYLSYKLGESLKEKGESLELDDNDNIKGFEERIAGLKTQFPTMFQTGETGKDYKPLDPNKLPPSSGGNETLAKEDILKKPYAERVKLHAEDPEAYKAAMAE